MHQDDFAHLEGIASHRVLTTNVKSITYFAEEYPSPVVSFERFKERNLLSYHAPPSSPNSTPQAKAVDELTSRHEYVKYERMLAVQDQIKVNMCDLDCLKHALAKFTGLRHATMSSGSDYYEGSGTHKASPFEAPIKPPTHWLDPEGVRHLKVMLETLASKNIQVESLRASTFDWRFFDKSSTELERLFRPGLGAVHVELEMTLELDGHFGDVDGQTGKCRQFMKQGMVRDVLARLMKLKLLRVAFIGDVEEPCKPAVLSNIMSPSHHWPHLTQLELSGVAGDRHTVMQVLRLHKHTLRFLCLEDFDLGETSWAKLLPDIRNTLYLEGVYICGDLTGHVEEYPDKGKEELWGLDWPEPWSSNMRASVDLYCRNRGKGYPDELPLTDEVVEKQFVQYVADGGRELSEPGWEASASWIRWSWRGVR